MTDKTEPMSTFGPASPIRNDLVLSDGRRLQVGCRTYPIPPREWAPYLSLWQLEWPRTDVDWLEALRGGYADTLTICMAHARLNGELIATASVYFPRVEPEVCCVADVVTQPKARGFGIAAHLTETVVQHAFQAGCRLAYLGNKPKQRSVYEKVGFARIRGAVMRRAAERNASCETELYAMGQLASVRPTVWGDLPGVACLMAQRLDCLVADYPRGLMSLKYVEPLRCVSNFTCVWNDVVNSGGTMLTLAGATRHRVLGFATLTIEPPPCRSHRGVLDVVAHDHYAGSMNLLVDQLLAEAQVRNLRFLQAYVAAEDSEKRELLSRIGFRSVATMPAQLRVSNRIIDVVFMELALTV